MESSCINPITLKCGTVVPCGYCGNCVRRKQQDWIQRLQIEQFHSYSSHFLTLTYQEDQLHMMNGVSQLNMPDTQKFLKRLRKFQNELYDGLEPIRYYLVGEYGEKYGRAHYHVIIFNLIPKTISKLLDFDVKEKKFDNIWEKGSVYIGTVTPASINYVTSYVITRYHYPGRVAPFATMSKKPGIGFQYLTKQSIDYHNHGKIDFFSRDGVKRAMPRYYFNRIFNNSDRLSIRQRQLMARQMEDEKRASESGRNFQHFFSDISDVNRYNSERVGNDLIYTF